jgi:hypothetical protein
MVRRVVGVNEAGGKEGPRGGIFVSSRARGAAAATAVDLRPPHGGRSGEEASGMFILMLCEPAEAVIRLRARAQLRSPAPRRRRLRGGDPLPSQWRDWLTPTPADGSQLTSGPPVLDDYLLPRRPAPLPQKLSLECVPRCRGGGGSHGRCGYFQNTLPANEISIEHEPAGVTTCALVNIRLHAAAAFRPTRLPNH